MIYVYSTQGPVYSFIIHLLVVVGIDIICVYILVIVSDSLVKLDSWLCALYTLIILHEESLFSWSLPFLTGDGGASNYEV
jgi:hypothetical protein